MAGKKRTRPGLAPPSATGTAAGQTANPRRAPAERPAADTLNDQLWWSLEAAGRSAHDDLCDHTPLWSLLNVND